MMLAGLNYFSALAAVTQLGVWLIKDLHGVSADVTEQARLALALLAFYPIIDLIVSLYAHMHLRSLVNMLIVMYITKLEIALMFLILKKISKKKSTPCGMVQCRIYCYLCRDGC